MSVLGIILARAGSKRLPNKNVKLLNGKPLIEYTIDASIQSNSIDTLVVSTDSEEIKLLCYEKYYKDIIVIDRPKYLATDNASSEECILHIMDNIEKHDYILLLQPTSPLRDTEDIKNFINGIYTHSRNEITDKINGTMYKENWDDFYKNRKFFYIKECAYYMSEEKSIDINTEFDFKVVELLLKEREK